ncbi:tyrosine-type recombinase/integrase [Geomonas propionica]|uniref:Tyrosine-type recombinase/integrase n=1 Tax=Geomonas propionica TaxID=2798582 RepID=A0ABS0YQA6_9BACT|nr:tyrosine-type recombinase/integrase [Geomonas propionica]MBJ6800160.1 tyrosine-type recombinase/integrase [Geomonas propionica]
MWNPKSASNSPKEGSIISVEPIRSRKHIDLIKKALADKPRDYALFVVGINTAYRASELLALTVGKVRHLQPGDTFTVREQKTSKKRDVTLNKAAYDALQALLTIMPDAADDVPIFNGRKGDKALTVSTLNRLVKEWCSWCNLPGNYGSHTLRKTWGYHQRVTFKRDLPEIMVALGHSSQRQTLHYLCIADSEIQDLFLQGEL